MNKIIFFLFILLCGSGLLVDAQNNDFEIYGTTGDAIANVLKENKREPIYVGMTLHSDNIINIEKGRIDLKKKDSLKIREITPVTPIIISVLEAWEGKYKEPDQSSTIWGTSIWGESVDQGNQRIENNFTQEDSVFLSFAFRTTTAKSTILISKNDSLTGFVIRQLSKDTLYARVFWDLDEGKIEPISYYLDDPLCIIEPSCINVYPFNQTIPITWPYNSKIYIIYSNKKEKTVPNITTWKGSNVDFYQLMKDKGFIIRKINVGYVNE